MAVGPLGNVLALFAAGDIGEAEVDAAVDAGLDHLVPDGGELRELPGWAGGSFPDHDGHLVLAEV